MCRTKEQHPNPSNIGLYLRTRLGLTQAQAAKRAGLSPNDICRFERGTRGLTVRKVVRLAAFYHLTVDELMRNDYAAVLPKLTRSPVRSPEAQERFRRRQLRKLETGAAGELFAAEQERKRLRGTVYENGVNGSFADDSGAGYDIFSFTPDGRPKYIEVKASTAGCDEPFYMTDVEYRFFRFCLENDLPYELHRVYHLRDESRAKVRVYTARELSELVFSVSCYAVARGAS